MGTGKEAPRVSIIILNWNGWKDTIECLESLYQITYPNYDVIVVDNCSEDDSVDKIKEYAEGKIRVESKFFEYSDRNKPIKIIEYTREEAEAGGGKEKEIDNLPSDRKMIIIRNEKNYGFAEGNNIGMRYALKALNPEYILLLNNDTVVNRRFLEELVKEAYNSKKVGICSPKILNMRNPRIIDSTGHIFSWGHIVDRGHGEIDKGQYDKKRDIMGSMGSAALYKSNMLRDIGFLDASFITSYEDAEFSWRAYQNGWKARFSPGSIVYHKRGSSIKRDVETLLKIQELTVKNMTTTMRRYATLSQKILFTMFVMLYIIPFIFFATLIGKKYIGIRPYIRSILELYRR